MKYWGILVAALYLFILITVVVPLGGLLIEQGDSSLSWWQNISGFMRDFLRWPQNPRNLEDVSTWIYLAVMFFAQAALLSVPVAIAEKRPVTKRSIIPLVAATSLMMGLLVFGAALALNEAVRRELFFTKSGLIITLAASFLMWGFWAWVFYRWSKMMSPRELVSRQCGCLLKGSILELLIVVPAHIVARQRTDCCAGLSTFCGIAFGISVMFFCFGPGVFFLFVERLKYLRRKA